MTAKDINNWIMYHQINHLARLGFSASRIARYMVLDARTVKKLLAMSEPDYEQSLIKAEQRPKALAAYESFVHDKLKTYQDTSAAQIHDWLKESYSDLPHVSPRSVYNFVMYIRQKHNIPVVHLTREYFPIEELPYGEQAQVDFGIYNMRQSSGNRKKVWFFAMVLSRSRMKYVCFWDIPYTAQSVCLAHEAAFAFFEGIPKTVVYDQDRTLLVEENLGNLLLTAAFKQYVSARKYQLHFCRKADPESKGKVENVIQYEEFAKGILPAEQVRKRLLKEGLKLGKNQFLNMLKNPVYVGLIKLSADSDLAEEEDLVPGLHEPIVPEELYCLVQDIFEGKTKPVISIGKFDDDFPLRGHLVCPQCNRNWTASYSRSRNKMRYGYYHCQGSCNCRHRSDLLHESLISFLDSFKIPDVIQELYLEILKDVFAEDEMESRLRLQRNESKIAAIKEKMNSLDDKYLNGDIDDSAYKRLMIRLEEQEGKLLSDNEIIQQSLNKDFLKYLECGISLINQLSSFYCEASIENKHRLIGSIFPGKLIFSNGMYRTTNTNLLLSLSSLNIKGLHKVKKEKTGISSGPSN